MQKSVLTEIVRSLQKKEIRELNKWLQSPSHNQRQDVVRLFDYMVKYLPLSDETVKKEAAWKNIFPSEPYDDAFMRQVMYFLLKAIEEYLVFTDFMGDKVQNQVSLARIFRKRKLEKAYRQAYRLGNDHLESQSLRNRYYLMNRFLLEQEEYEHKLSITQNDSVNLQEMANAFENWIMTEKLLVSNAMFAHYKVYQKIQYNHGFLQELLSYTERKNELLAQPALAAQYYSYMAMTQPQEDTYFDLFEKLIFSEAELRFNQVEVLQLYMTALNYCAAKVNQGNLDYCRRALAFYKKGVENGALLENNTITRYTFGNAVAFALKIGEFEWAENFIENFKHHLEERQRDSIINFNLSRIYFEKGDFEKAQRLLTRFEYDDMLFNIIAKTMLLKIYYETEEIDALESLLDSMRIYLRRKEALDPTRKAAFKNLISIMKKMLSVNVFSRPQKEKFKELIQQTNPLAEKEWLLKQVT